ncbi:hypothetical protein [Bacillus cereus]|nr:hypothetical protein [Bacillus cereus]
MPSVDSLVQDKNYKLNSLNEETVDLRNWQNALHELAASVEGEGDEMEELKEKMHEMDKKISLIEERVKRLDKLPSGPEIKQMVSEVIDSKNLANMDKVELEMTKSRNVQIIWTIGTIITVVVAAIKLL